MTRLTSASVGAAIIAVWTLASSATPLNPVREQRPSGRGQTGPVFRSGVEVTTLSVTVTGKNGRPVTDLTRDDFVILEDAIEQEIVSFQSGQATAPEPIGLGLVVDVSGSMASQPVGLFESENRLAAIKTAIERLIKERLRRGDGVYVLAFDSSFELVQPWTTDHESAIGAIRQMRARRQPRAFLESALYDGIAVALRVSAGGTQPKQVVLIITDGNDNRSVASRAQVAEFAIESGALVYAFLAGNEALVRLREPAREIALEQISEITDPTGGFARQVAGFQQLEDAILKLGREFTQQQYELGYVRRRVDAGYHEIDVRVRRPDVTVRHRRGLLVN
jgi:Ca-activated chloride channel family protein